MGSRIRYTYVIDYLTQLETANVSYAAAAREAKLPLLVTDPSDFIAKRPLWRFVTHAARAAHLPLLGLRAGLFTVATGNGAILADHACVAGPTLLDGLRTFLRLAQQEANEFPAGIVFDGGGAWPWQRGLTPVESGPPGAEPLAIRIPLEALATPCPQACRGPVSGWCTCERNTVGFCRWATPGSDHQLSGCSRHSDQPRLRRRAGAGQPPDPAAPARRSRAEISRSGGPIPRAVCGAPPPRHPRADRRALPHARLRRRVPLLSGVPQGNRDEPG